MTAEEANAALEDINMYNGQTTQLQTLTSKDEQVRVNQGSREGQNNKVKRNHKKLRKNTNTNENNVSFSPKEEIENLKKDVKHIKGKLKAIPSQQWLANKEEANNNKKIKNIIKKNQKIAITLDLTNTRKQKYQKATKQKK